MSRLIPKVNVTLSTINVETKTKELQTVKDVYCKTILGEFKTFFYWLFFIKKKSYNDYLNTKITVSRDVEIKSYEHPDIQDKIVSELKTNGTSVRTRNTNPVVKYKKKD